MKWLNWILGGSAAVLWCGVFLYYFRLEIRTRWKQRKDFRW